MSDLVSPAQEHFAWTARLRERYARTPARLVPLGLIWLERAPAIYQDSRVVQTQLTYRPQLQVALHVAARVEAAQPLISTEARAVPASPMTVARMPPGSQGDHRQRGYQELAQRVAQQHARVEQRPQTMTTARPAPPAADAVLRSSTASTPVFAAPAVVKAPAPETYESPRGARASAPGMAHLPNPVAPVDLDRLTEQVVKEIDNRIVAYRERMGRVF